jgi:hypothetical protein
MTTARPHPIFSGIRISGPVLVLAGLIGELTVAQSSAKALSPCPAVEKPVCARLAGRLRSYGNACEAENAGATVIALSEVKVALSFSPSEEFAFPVHRVSLKVEDVAPRHRCLKDSGCPPTSGHTAGVLPLSYILKHFPVEVNRGFPRVDLEASLMRDIGKP